MRILLPAIALLLFSACDTQSKEKMLSLDGFDWTHKKIIELQPELNEISGIAYNKDQNNFLAINDEQGILFVLNPEDFSIQRQLKFGKKGDYECVAVNGDHIFVLKSNGDVHSMIYDQDTIREAITAYYQGPTTEFESTLWDDQQQTLRLISKKSATDKEIQANNMYDFSPATGSYSPDSKNKISWADLRKKGSDIKAFHPSGAAIQPGTGNIFVVSSIEKLLVVFNAGWEAISIHQLDEKLFRQPEGIAFDKEGNLLITNEAADAKPTLILIPIKK